MNVLIVGQNNKNWMYETLYNEQMALFAEIQKNKGRCYFFGPGFENCEDLNFKSFCKKKNISQQDINLIIFYISHYTLKTGKADLETQLYYKNSNKNYLSQLNCIDNVPRFLWLNDFWHTNKFERIIYENNLKISHIFSTYFYHLNNKNKKKFFLVSKYSKKRIFHINRSVSPSIVVKNNTIKKKNIDVTLLGATDNFYPERKKFLELLKIKKDIKFFHKEHPGYNFKKKIDKNKIFGKKYFNILKKTKIFVTCGTKYNLPIIKLYEILASGCLLMTGKINNLKKIKLIKNKNFIEINEKNFIKKLDFYLKNPKILSKISNNGLNLIKKNFLNTTQAKIQYKIINNVLQNFVQRPLLNKKEIFFYNIYVFIYNKLKIIKKLFFHNYN